MMIIEEIKKIKTGKKEYKNFGYTMGAVFFIILVLLFVKNGSVNRYFLAAAALFCSAGLIVPFLLKPFYLFWMSLSVVIGWFMTRLILVFLFYLVVTPVSLLSKIAGKKFLEMGFREKKESYWIKIKDYHKRDKDSYERQY